MNKVLHGDCLEEMKKLEDNSIDAVVTDPPYGLSFMGKKWDYDVPSQEIWEECLRVLKPGGYLLAFAGTRTQHRMAVRIEDAGFEIRDMIAWVYGSGFPKSLNIGKAVDRLQGNEREVVGETRIGKTSMGDASGWDTSENMKAIKESGGVDITKGTSEWEGWGTALKPALEPITVARKPISEKTVAENCLKWGTGGINIDESRVDYNGETPNVGGRANHTRGDGYGFKELGDKIEANTQGRFPANLIHDNSEEVRECFPETKTGKAIRSNSGGKTFGGENTKPVMEDLGYDDNGGNASRFFKSIPIEVQDEIQEECTSMEEKLEKLGLEQQDLQKNADEHWNNQCVSTKPIIYQAKASKSSRGEDNNHPTVKPVALMEYLVTLVSREGAVVLDPFAGSGSTLLACKNINRQYMGIEREQEYIDIINKRLG